MKIVLVLLIFSQMASADLMIYTDRVTARLQPIADQFTALTGEKVQILELAYPQIKERLIEEKENSPADLVFVKDLIYLNEMTKLNWFQKFNSDIITSSVPENLRQSNNLWTAISMRARILIYNSSLVNPAEIENYQDLAEDKWAGRICLRSGTHPYNQALVSSFVANYGADRTQKMLTAILANLAAEPLSGDSAVINAVATGQCDVGIVNHYYLAPLVDANPAFIVKPLFLNQKTTGVHVNGSGMGIYRYSKQNKLATQFLELMMTDEAQLTFSKAHYDYPVKLGLSPSSMINQWGPFKADTMSWEKLGDYFEQALKIISDVQYR
jgi:iron(III) transport system substrate-binding protein